MSENLYDKLVELNQNETEISRLKYQASWFWKKESLYLQSQMTKKSSILDLGCGPGFISKKLLQLYPQSTLTAMDINSDLLDHAKDFLNEFKEQVTIHQADVYKTGLTSESFDYVYARLIFQHLANPIKAAAEIHRILKNTGKLIIFDADIDLFARFHPPLDIFHEINEHVKKLYLKNGANWTISRILPTILKKAGFNQITFSSISFHSSEVGAESLFRVLPPTGLAKLNVDKSLVTKYEEGIKEFLSHPEPQFVTTNFFITGQK